MSAVSMMVTMSLTDYIYELQCIAAIISLSIVLSTTWMLYRHVGDINALKLAKQRYGKNNAINIRRMGILSELWQIMYETNNSPIIHAFENGPDAGYHLLSQFWQSFSEKYINWRSVPIKVNGKWFWKEIDIKEIKIEDHCKFIKLKSIDGDTQKAVTKFVNDLNMNRPFNPDLPPWEAYYISFEDAANEAYGYGRFHHAIGDGVLLNRLFQMEHSNLWEETTSSSKPVSKKNRRKEKNKSFYDNIKIIAFRVYNLIKYTPFSILDLMSLFLFESAPLESGIHSDYAGKDTYEYMIKRKLNIAISNKFLLKDIKEMCKKYGDFTINDFVMSIFCEAVYQYIFQYVCNNDQDQYDKIVSKYGQKLYLRFFTIFNMRSLIDTDIQRLSTSYASGLAENDLSTVPIRLPCGKMKFMDRFNEIHHLFYKLKNGPTPLITSLILKVGHFLFGLKFVNMILGKVTASKCTFTLSNLMGPKQPLLSGPKVNDNKDNYVWNVFNGTNPTHTPISTGIMSYVDYITFTMVADENSIKNPNEFMQCLHDVYNKSILI